MSESVDGRYGEPVLVSLSVGSVAEIVDILHYAVCLLRDMPAHDACNLVDRSAAAALC